jgi:hypothetical protein
VIFFDFEFFSLWLGFVCHFHFSVLIDNELSEARFLAPCFGSLIDANFLRSARAISVCVSTTSVVSSFSLTHKRQR